MKPITILIPTYNRPAALAATLTSLCFQSHRKFDLIISDQSVHAVFEDISVTTAIRILETRGCSIQTLRHLPRRGIAEHRQFLLQQSSTQYTLFLDDDLILEPYVISNLLNTIREQHCGFVGSAVIGLSYLHDIRPHQQQIELWKGKVRPEKVVPNTDKWQRHLLHNAANLLHLQQRLQLPTRSPIPYKIAWVGGCILYDTAKLHDVGGFSFWKKIPQQHCGEDVLVQLKLMEKYGGCAVIPSGVYHQELPTTIPDRRINAPEILFR